jgi:ribonuclease P protein component
MHAQHRLRDRADFQRLRRGGRRWNGRLLALGALRNDGPQTRFGFAIPRAVGKAVVRNRIRRRLREIARHALPTTPAGWDLVVTVRAPAAEASFTELRAAWDELLVRMTRVVLPRPLQGPENEENTGKPE